MKWHSLTLLNVVLIWSMSVGSGDADDPSTAAERLQSDSTEDLLIADFEQETYGDWTLTGDAFGAGPASGTLPGQMHVDGFLGKRLVNSFHGGDATTGTLTSPEFTIERRYIQFLIGGGKDLEKTCLNLVVDGEIVRSATGPNDQAGGSESLAPGGWDVHELRGKRAQLQIIDRATGGWGHINVDHIVQTNQRPPMILKDVQREFTATQRYLHIPIKNGAPKRSVTLLVGGRAVVRNDIELAPADPDWWAAMDISAWKGQSLTLQVDQLPEESTGLSRIEQSDALKNAESVYREPLRGQFHFSPRLGWNNDPNGLVYYNGEYHLFFQHNPYGWAWGNMHWGHAVSRDLVHWEELGDKLLPDDMGPMFSGSAVVDWKNTSGLGTRDKPPMILFYTAAGNPTVQCMAWSTDGRTFQKYSGNPIIEQVTPGNRDPKVIWHDATQAWVMVLYVEKPAGQHTVHFFTSPDLRQWSLASVTAGDPVGKPFLFECPDLFPLALDGDKTQQKWILSAANSHYAVGEFDGAVFTATHTRLPGHQGHGFYAAQTFSDIPSHDGRRIQIGWFQTPTPGMPFNQSMTVPLELRLISTTDGPRVTFTPVKELEVLRTKSHQWNNLTLAPGGPNPVENVKSELIELRAEFTPHQSQTTFTVRGLKIIYDAQMQQLIVNEHRAAAPLRDGRQRLIVLCDRIGYEIFASDGLTYVPLPHLVAPDDRSLAVEAADGMTTMHSLEVHELQSAWLSK